MSGRFAHLIPAAQRAAGPGQACTMESGAGVGAYASVGSWPLRESTGQSLAWPGDFLPTHPQFPLGNLVHSTFPSPRRVGRGKDGGRDDICLGEKTLFRLTGEAPLPHSIINTSVRMGQVCFLLLSLQD